MAHNRNNDQESESNMYSCLQCPSKFKQRFKLIRHIKYVHTQDEFQFDECTSLLGRRDILEKQNVKNMQLRSVVNVTSQHTRILNWQIM